MISKVMGKSGIRDSQRGRSDGDHLPWSTGLWLKVKTASTAFSSPETRLWARIRSAIEV